MNEKIDISVVVPVYNEKENLIDLNNSLINVLNKLNKNYEIIYIDDGSTDGSGILLEELSKNNEKIKVIQFRRNFGQTAAISAGFDYCTGDIVITIDADLQNDPEDIPKLIEKLKKEDYDLVSGWRKKRKDPYLTRILPSTVANKIISAITKVPVHDLGCSLKAYKKDLVKNLRLYGDLHRFIPVLALWIGAKIGELPVNHRPRKRGKSKYGLSRTIKVILDLITVKFLLTYVTQPIQIFGFWGLISILLGIISGISTILMRILNIRTMTRNPLLTITAILIIVGVQFIILGLLAEINIRTYYESQKKPIYNVKKLINFNEHK